MGHTLTISETARIEALLARLDHDAGGSCQVMGCTHGHGESTIEADLPALAA